MMFVRKAKYDALEAQHEETLPEYKISADREVA